MVFRFLYSFLELALTLVQETHYLFSVAGALNEKRGYGIIAIATFKWVL